MGRLRPHLQRSNLKVQRLKSRGEDPDQPSQTRRRRRARRRMVARRVPARVCRCDCHVGGGRVGGTSGDPGRIRQIRAGQRGNRKPATRRSPRGAVGRAGAATQEFRQRSRPRPRPRRSHRRRNADCFAAFAWRRNKRSRTRVSSTSPSASEVSKRRQAPAAALPFFCSRRPSLACARARPAVQQIRTDDPCAHRFGGSSPMS